MSRDRRNPYPILITGGVGDNFIEAAQQQANLEDGITASNEIPGITVTARVRKPRSLSGFVYTNLDDLVENFRASRRQGFVPEILAHS